MVPSSFRFPKAVYPLVGVGLQGEKIPARATEQHRGIYDLHLVSSTASSVSNASDSPHQPLIGRLRVTHQQQDQNHAEEGNQPRDDHNRVERMGARGLGRASEKWPISLKATIVPIPALVPLSPLTDATDSRLYRSDGSTFAIVVKPA